MGLNSELVPKFYAWFYGEDIQNPFQPLTHQIQQKPIEISFKKIKYEKSAYATVPWSAQLKNACPGTDSSNLLPEGVTPTFL